MFWFYFDGVGGGWVDVWLQSGVVFSGDVCVGVGQWDYYVDWYFFDYVIV